MAQLVMQVPHSLGKTEARQRLQGKIDEVRRQYSGSIEQLAERWDDGVLDFGFRAMGMSVNGRLEVTDSQVHIRCELPLAVAIFKGMIEGRIRTELTELLACAG